MAVVAVTFDDELAVAVPPLPLEDDEVELEDAEVEEELLLLLLPNVVDDLFVFISLTLGRIRIPFVHGITLFSFMNTYLDLSLS